MMNNLDDIEFQAIVKKKKNQQCFTDTDLTRYLTCSVYSVISAEIGEQLAMVRLFDLISGNNPEFVNEFVKCGAVCIRDIGADDAFIE
jgi:hypothetical protein